MRLRCIFSGPSQPIATGALLLLFLMSKVFAEASRNPYSSIAARNVFRLKDPPPPTVLPQPTPPRPTPSLLLTGIADFTIAKWAFVTRTDPGQPPKSYTLSVGEREGGLELIAMDVKNGSVTLRVDGTETVNLHFVAVTNQPSKAIHPPQLSGYPPRPFR
jgi:hypothetical protein